MKYTSSQIRAALIAAADHIEANPASYDFLSGASPRIYGRACMWGWFGHYLGIEPIYGEGYGYIGRVRELTALDWADVCEVLHNKYTHDDDRYDNPVKVADGMRIFAERQ